MNRRPMQSVWGGVRTLVFVAMIVVGAPRPAMADGPASAAVQPAIKAPPSTDSKHLGIPKTQPGNPTSSQPLGPRSDASGSPGLLRTMGSMVLVLGLIFGIAYIVKRFVIPKGGAAANLVAGARAPSGILQILGRYPMGRGQTLVLLKLDRRVLLLAQSVGSAGRRGGGAGVNTLCEVTDPDDVASILTKAQDQEGESIAAKFQSLMETFSTSSDAGDEEQITAREASAAELIEPRCAVEVADQVVIRSRGVSVGTAMGERA